MLRASLCVEKAEKPTEALTVTLADTADLGAKLHAFVFAEIGVAGLYGKSAGRLTKADVTDVIAAAQKDVGAVIEFFKRPAHGEVDRHGFVHPHQRNTYAPPSLYLAAGNGSVVERRLGFRLGFGLYHLGNCRIRWLGLHGRGLTPHGREKHQKNKNQR